MPVDTTDPVESILLATGLSLLLGRGKWVGVGRGTRADVAEAGAPRAERASPDLQMWLPDERGTI